MLSLKKQFYIFITIIFVCISAKAFAIDDVEWVEGNRFASAEEFIVQNGKIALDAISEESFERRCLGVKGLMDKIFDVSVMGRVALGRFAKNISRHDIAKYEELFKDYVFYNFLSQKSIDDVEGFKVTTSRVVSEKDVIVYADIKLSETKGVATEEADENVSIEFRVRKYPDGADMKIINVKVLSFDLVSAIRGDIRSIMNMAGNDFEEFLFEMEELVSGIRNTSRCKIFVKTPPS
jgi:ABC-type transporter MlaC component